MKLSIRSKVIMFPVLALALLSLGYYGSGLEGKPAVDNYINDSGYALDFKLKNVNGEITDLNSFKGKVLIVDFWDTWCPPCKKGIPEFIEMKNRYKDEDFEIVGIAFARDGYETVQKFAKEYKMNYTVLAADEETLPKLFKVYGTISAIPTAFIIDKNGKIVDKTIGYVPIKEFESKVKPLLSDGK